MRWEKLEQRGEVPEPRSSHSLTAVGDMLYLFGGAWGMRRGACVVAPALHAAGGL